MSNLAGVVRLLKKEQDRLTKELRGIGAALAAFGKAYGKEAGSRGRLSAAARARIAAAQSPLGKSAGKRGDTGQSCADSSEADSLGSRTKKDCRCAKGAMGTGEGEKENGVAGLQLS
jgi:hypothetical protein